MAGLTAPADNTAPAGQTIAADGWFPAIETEAVRQTVRLGEGTVTDARRGAAIEGAVPSALRALAAWRSVHAAAGIAQLDQVTPDEIGGRNLAVVIWERIIRFYAAAELADMHADVSATDDGMDRDEEKRDAADMYRRKAYEAVADMRAIGAVTPAAIAASARNRVELI